MSKTIEITDNNYETLLGENTLALVDFWAEWCGPCRMIGPIVEELAEKYADQVLIGKVNVDNNPAVAAKFGIRSLPTLLLFKNNEIIDKQIGVVPKSTLEQKIDAQLTHTT